MVFKIGESGNPFGRPKGALAKRAKLSQLLEPHASQLINKVVELAKEGDVTALKICIERLIPKPREEVIEFELPDENLATSQTLLKLGERVIKAAATGEITLEQSQRLTSLIESQGKFIYLANLESRLIEVENLLKQRDQISNGRGN